MRSFKSLTFVGVLATAASGAIAAPPPVVTQGSGAATACATCHGVNGAGNAAAGFPVLAQLPSAYFIKQISDFKAGSRSNPVMTPIAKAMSAEDIKAAANYYVSQPRPKGKPSEADASVIERGENLAINGAWSEGAPPCFKCHASDGTGVGAAFPPIAGQHATYTSHQLEAWKTGARKNDPQGLMKAVAEKLSGDDIHAVAEYLATLDGREAKK